MCDDTEFVWGYARMARQLVDLLDEELGLPIWYDGRERGERIAFIIVATQYRSAPLISVLPIDEDTGKSRKSAFTFNVKTMKPTKFSPLQTIPSKRLQQLLLEHYNNTRHGIID